MIVYIITKCGRILTNEAIQSLLEQVTLSTMITEKKITYVYRCGPSLNNPTTFSKELNDLTGKYIIIYYVSYENWQLLCTQELEEFLKALKDPNNQEKTSGEILSIIID